MFFPVLTVVLTVSLQPQSDRPQIPPTPPPMTVPAPPPRPPTTQGTVNGVEVAAVTHGWMLLSQGLFAEADSRAADLMRSFPRSQTVLALALEARLANQGAPQALDQYEAWLGDRTLEEPAALRRIALGFLREQARSSDDVEARTEAARLLRDSAGEDSQQDPAVLDRAGIRAQAAAGQPAAINAIVKELDSGAIDASMGIQILGDSGSPAAVKPLLARLKDPRPEIRGSAADAVGRIPSASGNREVAAALNALLGDESSFVRVRAATALYRIGDEGGTQLLRDLATSESAQSRLVAAEAFSSRPDDSAVTLLRGLLQAEQPEVRVRAAELLAPYDPALARAALEQLASDPNPVIREMAAKVQPAAAGSDLTALRRLLRSQNRLARVRAAGQIVTVTR